MKKRKHHTIKKETIIPDGTKEVTIPSKQVLNTFLKYYLIDGKWKYLDSRNNLENVSPREIQLIEDYIKEN